MGASAVPAPGPVRKTPAIWPRIGGRGWARRAWVRPPRPRTVEDGWERHASWLDLAFDLVFVVAIAKLAHELVLDHSAAGFVRLAAPFVPVFVA